MSVRNIDDRWPTTTPGNQESYCSAVPVRWALRRHTSPEWEVKSARWRNDACLPEVKLVDGNTQFIAVGVRLPRDMPALSQPCNIVRTFGEGVAERYYGISGLNGTSREEIKNGYALSALGISKPHFHSEMGEAVEPHDTDSAAEGMLFSDISAVVAAVCGVSQRLTADVGVQSGLASWK